MRLFGKHVAISAAEFYEASESGSMGKDRKLR